MIEKGQALVLKGFVDAKSDHTGRVFVVFVAATNGSRNLLVEIRALAEPLESDLSWQSVLCQLREMSPRSADDGAQGESFGVYEKELQSFFTADPILPQLEKSRNVKAAEQKITRLFSTKFGMRAVTILEMDIVDEPEVLSFVVQKEEAEAAAMAPEASSDAMGDDASEGAEIQKTHAVMVNCEPILDPVGGVAMSDLKPGDYVQVKLEPNSLFNDLLRRSIDNFDGTFKAEVEETKISDTGSSIITLNIAPGIAGVMKLIRGARIHMADAHPGGTSQSAAHSSGASTNFQHFIPLFVVISAVIFVAIALFVFLR